jgi:AcrR family transcriptional regulator
MPLRKAVTRLTIAAAARKIIEQQGVAALSMRALASVLEIKAPSLYDHVKNRDAVIALVQSEALNEFGEGFAQAGASTREKVAFYRDWALANPHIYPVVFQQYLHRDLITPGLELKVLGLVVEAAGGSHVQARVMWAQLHGLVDLELRGRLPADADMDATWEQVIVSIEKAVSEAKNAKTGSVTEVQPPE